MEKWQEYLIESLKESKQIVIEHTEFLVRKVQTSSNQERYDINEEIEKRLNELVEIQHKILMIEAL